jgi:putative membrane protein
MKKYILGICMLSAIVACNNNATDGNGTDSTGTMPTDTEKNISTDTATTSMNNDGMNVSDTSADLQFIAEQLKGNYKEIALVKMAQEKGTSAGLKKAAAMMEKDHKALVAKLKPMYTGVQTIDSMATDVTAPYAGLTGDAFDKAITDSLTAKHAASIPKWEAAATTVQDAKLKTLVRNTIPTLKKHHDMLMKMDKKMKM